MPVGQWQSPGAGRRCHWDLEASGHRISSVHPPGAGARHPPAWEFGWVMSFKQPLGGARAPLGGEGCSRESIPVMLSCGRWAEPAPGELGRKGEGICQQKRFSPDPGRSISKRKGKKDTTVGNISDGKTRILTLIIKTFFPHKNAVFFPVGIVGNYTN